MSANLKYKFPLQAIFRIDEPQLIRNRDYRKEKLLHWSSKQNIMTAYLGLKFKLL
jgi:hypothetical protein